MPTGRVLPETIRVRYATSKSQGMPEKKVFRKRQAYRRSQR